MKKTMILILAVVLCVALLASCTAAPSASSASAPASSAAASATAAESASAAAATSAAPASATGTIKLGYVGTLTAQDPASQALLNVNKQTAEALGAEWITYDTFDYTPDGLVTAVQTLISQHVQAIEFYNVADQVLPSVQKLLDAANIPFIINAPVGADAIKTLSQDPLFLGTVYEENLKSSETLVQKMASLGVKNMIILSVPQGNQYAAERDIGIANAVKETGIKVLKTYTSGSITADEVTKNVQDAIAAFPEMDGIFIEASYTPLITPAVVKVLQSQNLTEKVKLGGYDHGNAADYIGKELSFISVSAQPSKEACATSILINSVKGIYKPVAGQPAALRASSLYFDNATDFALYAKNVEDPSKPIFSQDYLKQNLGNAATAADYQKFCDSYTFDYIKTLG